MAATDAHGHCGEAQFKCLHTRLCIAEQLQCNGQYNCGLNDDTDEENCVRLPDHTNYHPGVGTLLTVSLTN